jgi:hypothetical protein
MSQDIPLDIAIQDVDPSLIAGLKAPERVANQLNILLRHRLPQYLA